MDDLGLVRTGPGKDRVGTQRVVNKLLDAGEEYNLGGTGQPVAIVVVYPGQAFVKAGWPRDRADSAQALLDAMADEAQGA